MSPPNPPPRPPTPQLYTHHLPSPISLSSTPLPQKPTKHLILIHAPISVPGKSHIALSTSRALAIPYFDGDALHSSAARAAMVGVGHGGVGEAGEVGGVGGDGGVRGAGGVPNVDRYRRMWLSKMVRTGLLFPEARRKVGEEWGGFGGSGKGSGMGMSKASSSATTSRRGSVSSAASGSGSGSGFASDASEASERSAWNTTKTASAAGVALSASRPTSTASTGTRSNSNSTSSNFTSPSNFVAAPPTTTKRLALSASEQARRANPALMVLTHPELEEWHKLAIRRAVGEYRIGVVFVPLYAEVGDEDEAVEVIQEEEEEDEDELPILRPLDPRTMTSFGALVGGGMGREREVKVEDEGWSAEKEVKLRIDVNVGVEDMIVEIVEGVRGVIGAGE